MYDPLAQDELHNLPDAISTPRFATYLQARGNDREAAPAVYRWSLEVSTTSTGPLNPCEIAVRNGIVDAIKAILGRAWPWKQGFIRSVPLGGHYNAKRDQQNCAARHQAAGKVVVELKLASRDKMLTLRFHQPV